MPVVTFTTDWGCSDFYVGALKGAILSHLPQAVLVDISHSVEQHNEAQAAFTVRNAYAHFPKGSIHIIGVGSEQGKDGELVVMEADRHYFISASKSCLSLLFLPVGSLAGVASGKKVAGFGMLGSVPHVVHQLMQGVRVKDLGAPAELPERIALAPIVRRSSEAVTAIVGHILHIDSYGNAVTNITRALYDEHAGGRPCTVLINSNRYKVPQIFEGYADVEEGNPVAFFNSLGLLEVAVCQGNASHLYRLNVESCTITVAFQ